MKIKKILINSFLGAKMHRVLLVLEDEQQVSFWVGEGHTTEDVVENLLAASNDLVRKAQQFSAHIHQTISPSE